MQSRPVDSALVAVAEAQMTSAAAFVAGGVQDALDEACSICLENFGDNDPATITTCKHEYHLQCILEWSQRSNECPMCWQPLSLKDPESQSLLAGPEQERILHHQRSPPFYQHAALEDTEFHRFAPSYGDDADLEDRIMHHLAAAALGRAQQYARRGEALRFRPSPGQGNPQFMIVPSPSAISSTQLSSVAVTSVSPNLPESSTSAPDLVNLGSITSQAPGGRSAAACAHLMSEPVREQIMDINPVDSFSLSRRRALLEPVETSQQDPSPLDLSFSETLKSRLVAASSRYKESLTKTTRGFRERLRVRNGAIAELGARAREVSAGVVRAVERMSLEAPDKSRNSSSNAGIDTQGGSMLVQSGPSCVSDRSGDQECSSSSLGEIGYAGSVTARSSTNIPQSQQC